MKGGEDTGEGTRCSGHHLQDAGWDKEHSAPGLRPRAPVCSTRRAARGCRAQARVAFRGRSRLLSEAARASALMGSALDTPPGAGAQAAAPGREGLPASPVHAVGTHTQSCPTPTVPFPGFRIGALASSFTHTRVHDVVRGARLCTTSRSLRALSLRPLSFSHFHLFPRKTAHFPNSQRRLFTLRPPCAWHPVCVLVSPARQPHEESLFPASRWGSRDPERTRRLPKVTGRKREHGHLHSRPSPRA